MRVIFYGEPRDPTALPKQVADKESEFAAWKSIEELEELRRQTGDMGLRGEELLRWGKYIRDGGLIAPMSYSYDGRTGEYSYDGFFRMEDDGPLNNAGGAAAFTLPAVGMNPDLVINEKLWTPLMLATSEENEAEVRRLLLMGANGNAVTHKGRSALHIAVSRDNISILCLLLLSGSCDLSIKDRDGLMAKDFLQSRMPPHTPPTAHCLSRMMAILTFYEQIR